jgi:hypothetical protein
MNPTGCEVVIEFVQKVREGWRPEGWEDTPLVAEQPPNHGKGRSKSAKRRRAKRNRLGK